MPNLQLETVREVVGGVTIIRLKGAVDASNMTDFTRCVEKACQGNAPRVLVNCQDLTYVNSTSFGLLFKFHGLCRSRNGQFALCAVSAKLLNIIGLLGLNKFLTVYPTQAAAMKAMQAGDHPST